MSASPVTIATYFLLGVLLGAAALVGGWYWYVNVYLVKPQYSTTNPLNDKLLTQNTSYSQAQTQVQQDDLKNAVTNYTQALAQATDPMQKAQIKFAMAVAYMRSPSTSDYMQAIPLFQGIAADRQNNSYRMRAYAIEYLGELFYVHHDIGIATSTFANAPYARMWVPNDVNLSYRHLYEYATAIYPLGLAEARIAEWYADDLLQLYAASSTPNQNAVASDKAHISEALAAADADIKRIQDSSQSEMIRVPAIELREAIVKGYLAELNLASASEVEQLFQKTQQLDLTIAKMPNYYTNYHYAVFLARQFGTVRNVDVDRLLAPIYNTATDSNNANDVRTFLVNERSNVSGEKPNIVLLASVDPKFQSYLMTIGWTAADLK